MYSNYDLDRLREFLPQYVEGITQRSTKGGRDMYNCPLCGSGTGSHGTGAFRLYRNTNTWFCFACQSNSGPNHGGDIFELIRQYEGIDGFNEQVQSAAAHAGITVKHERTDAATDFRTPAEAARTPQNAAESPQRGNDRVNTQTAAERPQNGHSGQNTGEYGPQEEPPADYTQYFLNCEKNLETAADYLAGRGLSLDTARRYRLGYDPQADPAGNPGGGGYSRHPETRLIIPVSKRCYVARSTNPATEPQYKKMFPKNCKVDIFNARCLYAQDVQEVFITEGAIDALSIIETGRNAVALNSTSNTGILIDLLQQRPTKATLIICLDNDEKGQKAADSLRAGLNKLNISFIGADICGEHKDPNEHLTADRQQFETAIAAAEQKAKTKPDNTADYIKTFMQGEIDRFKVQKNTGFSELDRKSGGLYSGLYVVAATSSLGKTTLCHQIAEQLAEGGHDVIFFSLEQSRLEMVSKSLARRIAKKDPFSPISSLSIRKGGNREAAQAAAGEYIAAVGDRLSVIEGDFSCNISFIGDYIRQYIRRNNTRPVVFIDYLQIVQPAPETDKRQGIRETIDDVVVTAKRLCRELDITIFLISSVNRQNYLIPFDMDALKESGGIEYTADVIYGLQLQCLHEELFEKEKAITKKRERIKECKSANPRKVELICIKNRYGISNYSVDFDYYPAVDLFKESGAADDFRPVTKNDAVPFDTRRKEKRL